VDVERQHAWKLIRDWADGGGLPARVDNGSLRCRVFRHAVEAVKAEHLAYGVVENAVLISPPTEGGEGAECRGAVMETRRSCQRQGLRIMGVIWS